MYKVLLVDDERFILDGLKEIIKWEEHGLEIVGEAFNGLEALKVIDELNVNILVTDLKMPLMDGLELIKQIRLKNLEIRVIILSGFDDFLYVREASKLGIENYLLKPVNQEELSLTLQNTIEQINADTNRKTKLRADTSLLRENILFRWITNKISYPELLERASILDITLNTDSYRIGLIRLMNCEKDNGESIDSSLKYEAMNLCTRIVESYCSGFVLSDLDDDILLLLTDSTHKLEASNAKKIFEECRLSLTAYLKIDTFITIGDSVIESSLVYQSYSNAKSLLHYSLIYPINTIVDYQTIKHELINNKSVFSIDYEEIKSLIVKKNKKETQDLLHKIFTKMGNSTGLTPAFIQNSAMQILFTILSAANIQNSPESTLLEYSDNLFYTIEKMNSITKITHWFIDLSNKVIDSMLAKDDGINPLVNRVIQYIEANYSKDMSIKTLSVTFKINASYLGQLFKSETGEMFSNYLHKVRMEKAKALLSSSDFTTNEVAEKVGYTSASYFINIFKKLTGQYPTHYKRSL